MPKRTAKSCGPGTPTLVSSFAAMIREATVAKKPGTPGRARISRKTIAQGRPDRIGRTCGDYSCAFHLCTRGCGCGQRPAFPAPSVLGGTTHLKNSGKTRCEIANACLPSTQARAYPT